MPWYMKLYEIKNNVLKVKRKWTEVFFVHDQISREEKENMWRTVSYPSELFDIAICWNMIPLKLFDFAVQT